MAVGWEGIKRLRGDTLDGGTYTMCYKDTKMMVGKMSWNSCHMARQILSGEEIDMCATLESRWERKLGESWVSYILAIPR